MTKSEPDKAEKRGGAGPKAVGMAVSRVTRPMLGKRGFADANILTRWTEIVGPALAAHTCPMKVSFPPGKRSDGVLHLKVEGGSFAVELQHFEPLLIDRINRFFGYGAVSAVRMHQGPLPPRPQVAPSGLPPLDAQEEAAVEHKVAEVDDPEIRAILAALGRAVKGRAKKQSKKG